MKKILQLLSLVLLAGMWIYTLVQYKYLPAQIPTHFNIRGNVDAYGAKETILLLPLIGTALLALVHFTSRNKANLNYPMKITEFNKAEAYRITDIFIACIQLMLVIMFGTIVFITCQTAMGNPISTMYLLVECGILLALVFGCIFNLISLKNN